MPGTEDRLFTLLMDQNHFFLIIGILAFLLVLRAIKPVEQFIFTEKWNWIIPVLNVSLSAIGVFALGMTSFDDPAMKLVVVLIISAVTSYSYELAKPLFKKLLRRFFKVEPETADNSGG